MSFTPRLACVGVLVWALAFGGGPARAGDPQRAKQLFQQGSVHFDLGQFDKAIENWQSAYEEKQDPGFLYNIGQAYRLSGDAKKAVFFYKSFLRNAPGDSKRREVEQKVVDLQKQIAETERKLEPTPSPPQSESLFSPTTPTNPTTSTDPPLTVPTGTPPFGPPTSTTATQGVRGGPPKMPLETETAPAPRIDVGVAPGVTFWLTGIAGDARPAFTLALSGGHTFDGNGRVRFRLGAAFTGTFLKETSSRETFLSILVNPGVRIHGTGGIVLGADLGLGILALTGLRSTSALLAQDGLYDISGVQSFLEVRPALSLAYRFSPLLAVSVDPALAYSPKKAHFHAPLVRLELLASLGFRF